MGKLTLISHSSPEMTDVVNVVGSGSLGRELDVRALGNDIMAEEVWYQNDDYRTPVVYIRECENGPLVTIYESGSYHITGAKSVEEAERTREWIVSELDRLVAEDVEATFDVRNIVVVGDLERTLNLNRIAIQFGLERVEYEPEQFPGLVFRPDEFDAVFLIFGSGKVVIPGQSTLKGAKTAYDWIVQQLIDDS